MMTEFQSACAIDAPPVSLSTFGNENRCYEARCDDVCGDTEPAVAAEKSVAVDVVADLLQAAHRLRTVLADHFAEFGLTDIRYLVLQILRESAPDGCSQSQLAARLGQSESSVCTLVKRMRDSELLFRLRSQVDRRNWVLKLSDLGNRLLDSAQACHGKRMSQLLAGMTTDRLSSLSGLLRQLSIEIDEADVTLDGESSAEPSVQTISAETNNHVTLEWQIPPAA